MAVMKRWLNKIICGDCFEVMKDMPDNSIDLILTDPPYGTTACKWDSIIPLEPMWAQLNRLIKPNGAIVMTASQPFTTVLIASNMKMFKYCWVWEKSRFANQMLAKKQPLKIHEDVIVFCSGTTPYNPQGLIECNKTTKQGAKITDNNGGGVRTPAINRRTPITREPSKNLKVRARRCIAPKSQSHLWDTSSRLIPMKARPFWTLRLVAGQLAWLV